MTEQEIAQRMIRMHGKKRAAENATDHAMDYTRWDVRRFYWLRIRDLIMGEGDG